MYSKPTKLEFATGMTPKYNGFVKTLGLIGILILGLALRIIWLDKYPPGFTPDEAAFGYNAYSLIQTGKDEWGTAWYSLPFTNLK